MCSQRNSVLGDALAVSWWLSLIVVITFSILGSTHILPASSIRWMPFLFVPLFALQAARGLVTDVVLAKGRIERARDPLSFWFAVAFYTCMAVAAMVGGIILVCARK